MEGSPVLFFCIVLSVLFAMAQCTTITVDGVSAWKNPTAVHIGDYIIFKHKYEEEYKYKVYIFRNHKAFQHCNFTQSTLLSNPNSSSFTWHPSRPGFFYFSFNNGSSKACQQGQKFFIKVSPSSSPPENKELPPIAAPLPPPVSGGGVVSASPSYLPFLPREPNLPAPAPTTVLPAKSPAVLPEKSGGGGGGIPFISSNPAVPLPMGEMDSATIRPFSSSTHYRRQVVGILQVEKGLLLVLFLVLI